MQASTNHIYKVYLGGNMDRKYVTQLWFQLIKVVSTMIPNLT